MAPRSYVLGRKPTGKMSFFSLCWGYLLSRWHHWLGWRLSAFSTGGCFPPGPQCTWCVRVTIHSPHARDRSRRHLEGRVSVWEVSPFSHLFISVWIWGYSAISRTVPASTLRAFSAGSCAPWTQPPYRCFCFEHILLFWCECLQAHALTFSAPAPESAIYPRTLDSLYWRVVLES